MRFAILFILTIGLRAEAMDLSGIEIRELPVSEHEMTRLRVRVGVGTKKERVEEIWRPDRRRDAIFEAQCIRAFGPQWHYAGGVSQVSPEGDIHNILCSRRDYGVLRQGARTIGSEVILALRKLRIGRDVCANRIRRTLNP